MIILPNNLKYLCALLYFFSLPFFKAFKSLLHSLTMQEIAAFVFNACICMLLMIAFKFCFI